MPKTTDKNTLRAPDNKHLIKALEDFELNKTQLADVLGISPGTISHWTQPGATPPKWTQLAVECLYRRQRKQGGGSIVVAKVPQKYERTLGEFLDALEINYESIDA